MKTHRLSRVAAAMVLGLGLTATAQANTTSSAIKGHITGPQGNAAAGTVVSITHVPSGTTKQVTVNEAGIFSAKGLRVGGPYKIVIDSDAYEDQEVKDVFLQLGKTYELERSLEAEQNMEVIAVTGRILDKNAGSTSPASNFNLDDLVNAPTVNRDIKDVVRVDPRIYIDQTNSDAINCAGGNPKFNSLTVDGTRMNDNFGLNSNGYPTVRIPFSYDAIDQVTVELAPFDVQYGGFTSCNINAVTKSGTNEVHGGLFYDYTSDSLKGDSLEGDKQDVGDYTEKRYGFNVGLPLIEDKLFLFAAYEKLDGSQILDYTPFTDGSNRITQEEIDRITQISKDVYEYDPGTMEPSLPVDDEKILVKLDWNINDQHRAAFVYNYNDGFEWGQSDADPVEISLSNHVYERGAELTSYVTSIYSDWTDDFSTEFRVGYLEMDNRQISRDADSGFGEFRVQADDIRVYIGPDDSRQSNKLKYDTTTFKLAGTYYLDDHELYFGIEREELDVFNLFVQHSQTETRFNSIDDFENGLAAQIEYGNASSHNPDDAAGEFKYALNTLYFQDKFELYEYDLTLMVGVRYDWYTSSDKPTENPNFFERYGYSNAQNLDGADLIQPRFGFNWAASDQLEVRGGFGLYSGGNPNVWISNSYSNDGVRNLQYRLRNSDRSPFLITGPDGIEYDGSGRPGYDIPVDLINDVSTGAQDNDVNATDPDFEIPSEWKYALGATYTTEDEYVIMADLLYTDKQDSAIIKNIGKTYKDELAPDGRPITTGGDDYLLTNVSDGGDTTVLSLSVSKNYDNGFSFTASYAYTESNDVHPMTSAVAFTNYHDVATASPNSLEEATSNYEIPHRFTLNISYVHEFFAGYETTFSLFGQANEGRPYTWAFGGSNNRTELSSGGFDFDYNDVDRQLLYVPLENDPLVNYGENFDLDAFNAFIDSEGLTRGEIMDRNELSSDWWVKFDVRVEQEFAGFMEGHKGSAFFVIENVGNLLNDDWGVLKQGSYLQGAVNASINDDNTYTYNEFLAPPSQSRDRDASLWEIRLGVKYDF
ncbi:TonB-dependent receptor [Thalassomonas actiniarum]|uniref:TonB-dependent receptor n=1 Tax=Thalassomonas actiniarum TaxID=485447 RepID=A0AAE9YVX7_9GAMM|nr:TonB-dependent receptor [Thalassomonas actiniarum]WDE01340.1 TonB-dependent receptor [Thalassomonas actiniarum]